jgi:predicted naringenin-chalcone synthase
MNESPVALSDFQLVQPLQRGEQARLIERAGRGHGEHLVKLFRRYAVSPEKIGHRSYECPEDLLVGASIRDRAEFFQNRALEVFREFYPAETPRPQHLIHVTCTGYVSPSAPQRVLSTWAGDTDLTHAYHMGCYAALPAARLAQALGHRLARVDIVHTEMCSLHMNPEDHSPEQMVVQSLFADGHVKYSARPAKDVPRGFKILNFFERLIPDSAQDMSWVPGPGGMQMTLSRQVPEKITSHLRDFLTGLAARAELPLAELLKNALFAVHPGGPKIIEAVRQRLELSREQVAASEKILFERGNMSSATLPHIWKEILDAAPARGTKVVSIAFGPGLTMIGGIFEIL